MIECRITDTRLRVRPRKDHRGVGLMSDVLLFGRLWYDGRNALSNGFLDCLAQLLVGSLCGF